MSLYEDSPSTHVYAGDIIALDAEPWNEYGTVDRLIELQQQVFVAEAANDSAQTGIIYDQMSTLEASLNNTAEEADYALSAAKSFEQAGMISEAVASYCVLARSYWALGSPDLGYDAFSYGLNLRVNHPLEPESMVGMSKESIPLKPLLSILFNMVESRVKFSAATVTRMLEDLPKFTEFNCYVSEKETASLAMWLALCYFGVSCQKSASREQKQQAKLESRKLSSIEWAVRGPYSGSRKTHVPIDNIAKLTDKHLDRAAQLQGLLKRCFRPSSP